MSELLLQLESSFCQKKLKNSYWIVRHGRSIPNEHGIIVSHPKNGCLERNGLSETGIQQAIQTGISFQKKMEEMVVPAKDVFILSSPFSRAKQTAFQIAKAIKLNVECSNFQVSDELRERWFGDSLELQSHLRYNEIWSHDNEHPSMSYNQEAESVYDVASRLISFLYKMECTYEKKKVVIVSHGDTLQIFQSLLFALDLIMPSVPQLHNLTSTQMHNFHSLDEKIHLFLARHRQFALETSEMRELKNAK